MTADAIITNRKVFTITIVCPRCHEPLGKLNDGVNECPHCKTLFRVRTVPGPTETK